MIKKIYNTENIVKIGSNTAEAVKKAVILVKNYTETLKMQGISNLTIVDILNTICNKAGSDMSERTFFALITNCTDTEFNIEAERREYVQLMEENQHKLKIINRYIVEKAISPLGASESRKIRELLSEEWAHAYVSLLAHKFNEEIYKTA